MGCASSKPATPKQKLGDDAKGLNDQHGSSKVCARPHPCRYRLTVQEMCISDRLAAFPDLNLGLMTMALRTSLAQTTLLHPLL